MTSADVIEISREGIWVLIKIGAPVMLVALMVGLAISLVQALTQIQEMTLSFVPKLLAIFVSLLVFLPFMMTTLVTYAQQLADRIVTAG